MSTFLPLVTEVRRWSDRKKKVELPLFSCYVFVKLTFTNSDERMRVYRTNGVFRIVSMRGEAVPIPDEQIDALRTGDRTLIISVDAIQRSLAVSVEGYDVEAL